MEPQPPRSRVFAICSQPKTGWIQEHLLFGLSVFSLSAAVGYFLTLSLSVALRLLSPWSAGAQEKINPLIEALKRVYSGFSR